MQEFGSKVLVGVTTAAALGALTLFWNWATDGGLVRTLGGMTKSDVARLIEDVGNAGADIPRGAVIAFDRDDLDADSCPPGWEPFTMARGRTIVGAGDPAAAPAKFGFDENGIALTHRVHRQHGGEEAHVLSAAALPEHAHELAENFAGVLSRIANGGDKGFQWKEGVDEFGYSVRSGTVGEGAAHNNMPPFIALYFCKKGG